MVTGGRAFNDRATVHATMDKVRVFAPDYRERRAPLKRNIRMLEERPDLLVVFPGGDGTAFTKRHALQCGLRVILATSF